MSATYYAMDLINRGFVVDAEAVGTRSSWEQGDWLCVEAWKDRDGNPERWWRRYVERDSGCNDGMTWDPTTYDELILESLGDGTYDETSARYVRERR